MLSGLFARFKRWRQQNREYAIQRALYKQGGGAATPSRQADSSRMGPPAATHGSDLSDLTRDE
jgi:hypothetical protein